MIDLTQAEIELLQIIRQMPVEQRASIYRRVAGLGLGNGFLPSSLPALTEAYSVMAAEWRKLHPDPLVSPDAQA